MPKTKKMIYPKAEFVTMALGFNFTSKCDYFLRASFCDSKFPYHPEMYYRGFNWCEILKTKEGVKKCITY